jgi:hypothetical protein
VTCQYVLAKRRRKAITTATEAPAAADKGVALTSETVSTKEAEEAMTVSNVGNDADGKKRKSLSSQEGRPVKRKKAASTARGVNAA